jgi:hypothetical protein
MPDASGTLETIALELAKALQPLEELLADGASIFTKLGEELPREISADANLLAKLNASATKVGSLDPLITALATAITNEDAIAIVTAGVPLLQTIADLITLLKQVGDALNTAANALPAADKARLQALAAELAVRMLEYVAVGYLDERMPTLTNSLDFLGIVDREPKPDEDLEVTNAPRDTIPRRFRLGEIPKLVVHPDQYLQQRFAWGDPAFDGSLLLAKTLLLLENLGVPVTIYETPGQPPVLEAYLFSVQADKSTSPPGLKAELSLPGNTTFDDTVDFSDLWKGTVHVEANYAAGVGVSLHPAFAVNAIPPSGNFDLKLLLGLKAQNTDGTPVTLLAVAGGTRLQAKSIGGSVGIDAHLSTSGGEIEPEVQLQVEDGKLIVDFSQGDGLIQKLLAGVKLEAKFPLTATWNPKDGLRVTGDAGLEVFIPLHQNLAIVDLNGLYFSLGIGSDSALHIGLAAQVTAHLGPIVATLDRIGADAAISFPPNGNGRLGMADFHLDFVPPKGVGLALDAGVIKGGGFLSVDTAKGEYAGALELTFQDVIALKAIGIINTKLPDGSPGFALLILVTAEFVPIQLGFGFTLVGVGGLLGLNRRLDTEALRVGVRTGALNSVLFPQDIIANITRIISDIKDIFPIATDHFVLGPMGKLGWGTPTLLSLEIGVIIDLPTPAIVIAACCRRVCRRKIYPSCICR